MRRPPLALLLCVLLLLPGCAAVVLGAATVGTVQYLRNEAYRDYPASVEATWSASLEAMRDLGYPVDPSVPYGRNGGAFELNDVELHVQETVNRATRVRVRVGTFTTQEHRDRARAILDAIGRRLGV